MSSEDKRDKEKYDIVEEELALFFAAKRKWSEQKNCYLQDIEHFNLKLNSLQKRNKILENRILVLFNFLKDLTLFNYFLGRSYKKSIFNFYKENKSFINDIKSDFNIKDQNLPEK
jgi:hypothetical protein